MSGSASPGPNMPYPAVLTRVSHGSHVCAFYETADDLLDLVLPFFRVGLDQGEVCVWMMPDGIIEDEAKIRVSEAVVERGLEFHPARDLYLRRGRFDRDPVMRFLDQKAQQAVASNHSGARISGDAFWLKQNDWNTFLEYESDLNSMIANKPTTLLCTYPFTVSKAGDVFDTIRAHQFAVAKHKDKWEVVTAPAVGRDRHIEAVDAATRVTSLTLRERQVLDAIIDGDPNKIIARNLAIDVRTVEAHRARLMRRLGVRTMVEAVRLGTLARFATQTPPSSTL
jgi:DNA-binding CsgD family transcriptional regulator